MIFKLKTKSYLYSKFKLSLYFLFSTTSFFASSSLFANTEKIFIEQSIQNSRKKIIPSLRKYCGQSCSLLDVKVELGREWSNVPDLGFEEVTERGKRVVSIITVYIQVDRKVPQVNRNRLDVIISNQLREVSLKSSIIWVPVDFPYMEHSLSVAQSLRKKVYRDVLSKVNKVIQNYCPNTCILSSLSVDGSLITPDEASRFDKKQIILSESDHTVFKLDTINISVALSDKISREEIANIVKLIKIKTQGYKPVKIESNITSFPESQVEKDERNKKESEDPYGLGKLKEMLILFRDLAGTKEIISSSVTKDQKSSETKLDSKFSSEQKDSSQIREEGGEDSTEWFIYVLVILLVVGLLSFVLVRFGQAQKDAKIMIQGFDPFGGKGGGGSSSSSEKESKKDASLLGDMSLRLKVDSLREESIEIFIKNPKVAKETFTRLLQEEGIKEAAKYVKIFGKLIVFELLENKELQRTLFELSEYYHKSEINLELQEQYDLLMKLKTKVTANEIKIMTDRAIDQFDFLQKLDTTQIINLITDENPQVQSIVIAQLSAQQRRALFDLLKGDMKSRLMHELCKADAMPKEYIQNVAISLAKKILAKPEFDTQNLRSSDIILELLEKAPLTEQKTLMNNLRGINPDAARAIKMKLVTLEMLPYLKGGHLLELVLGMEREDLLTFLAGTREHIRELLISHAPEELAESWQEDLENIQSVDESKYRVVEMMILGKIRQLASSGSIDLLQINQLIFSEEEEIQENKEEGSSGKEVSSELLT